MKIQIIGLGIVGTAQALLSQKFGHEVVGYDVRPVNCPYCKMSDKHIKDVDMTFICTHESVVENVIDSLVKIGYNGLIVIRSTVPIGDTERLMKKFDVHICHNPEFLKEKNYLDDIINPYMNIIGQCCPEHGDKLKEFYRPLEKPMIITNTMTSEITKLTMNTYLSTLITFWNEIDELCSKLKVDTKTISDILRLEPRMSNYGHDFFGSPYSGKCLPKDMIHLINGFHSIGLNPKLFEACESYNNDIKKKNPENDEKIK